ncbi:MAG: FtsX-like permease family protein, partial [Armatimonadota bacterium]
GVIQVRNMNRDLYLPVTTALKRFTDPDLPERVDEIAVQIADASQVVPSSWVMRRILERAHRGVEDYQIIIPNELLEQSQRTQRIFNIVMGSIAALSLLVGGIGIMNIMLATVTQRAREIGVRRCIGATRGDIVRQFLVECLVITTIGGIFGVVGGITGARAISYFADWKTVVSGTAVMLSLVVSFSVGLIFGLYPAIRAAMIEPMEALRAE